MLDKMKKICFGEISVYCRNKMLAMSELSFVVGLMTISFQQLELGK